MFLDVDECNTGQSLCSDGCMNTIGSYYCTCPSGYELDAPQTQCQGN